MEKISIADAECLRSDGDLRTIYKPPKSNTVAKTFSRIDQHTKRFIELSPFVCLGTTGEDGLGDVTPRGGEPGFIHVLNDTQLAMPDRPGNNRLDSLQNIVRRPGVGMLFFVPGFEDTLRLNGTAKITVNEALMQRFAADGKRPLAVVLIEVKEVYFHCAKALRRSGLWDSQSQQDRAAFPTMGEIYRDQLKLEMETSVIDAYLEKDARENLY